MRSATTTTLVILGLTLLAFTANAQVSHDYATLNCADAEAAYATLKALNASTTSFDLSSIDLDYYNIDTYYTNACEPLIPDFIQVDSTASASAKKDNLRAQAKQFLQLAKSNIKASMEAASSTGNVALEDVLRIWYFEILVLEDAVRINHYMQSTFTTRCQYLVGVLTNYYFDNTDRATYLTNTLGHWTSSIAEYLGNNDYGYCVFI
jgi:hypothetical protein